MTETIHRVEMHNWSQQGYRPLVFFGDWQVAHLNWEPLFDPNHMGEIERHKETDEVFVLYRGCGALFISIESGIEVINMEPGVIYNVTQGTWHNLISTRDASWIIIETCNTHLHDTEIRQMTDWERDQVQALLPNWKT